jgi:hypothetical protein
MSSPQTFPYPEQVLGAPLGVAKRLSYHADLCGASVLLVTLWCTAKAEGRCLLSGGKGSLATAASRLFGRWLAASLQLRIKRSLLGLCRRRPHVEVVEEFLDRLKAPFGLVRFNVDHLKSFFVVDWRGREVAEVANSINGYTQLVWKRLLWVGLAARRT